MQVRIPEQVVDHSEALRACFGVACGRRSRCARYAAVDESNVDPQTLVTCVKDASFPMFVDASSLRVMHGCARSR